MYSGQRFANAVKIRFLSVDCDRPAGIVRNGQKQCAVFLCIDASAYFIAINLHISQLALRELVDHLLVNVVRTGVDLRAHCAAFLRILQVNRKVGHIVSRRTVDHIQVIREIFKVLIIFRRRQTDLCHSRIKAEVDLLVFRNLDAVVLTVLHVNVAIQHIDRIKPGRQLHKAVLYLQRFTRLNVPVFDVILYHKSKGKCIFIIIKCKLSVLCQLRKLIHRIGFL